ncbi:hypothetical protein Gpo141_00000941 [Globisporangium polare]
MAFHGEGRAVLCFPRDGDWFQGYVFVQDPEADVQLGILAEELPIDDCIRCPDGGYKEYRLTLMHFDMDQETAVVVAKTGGDVCQLRSDELRFESTMLLTEEQAADAIRTYFPTIAARANGDESLLADCLVLFGDIEIMGVDFQPKSHES